MKKKTVYKQQSCVDAGPSYCSFSPSSSQSTFPSSPSEKLEASKVDSDADTSKIDPVTYLDFGEQYLDPRITRSIVHRLSVNYPRKIQLKAIPELLRGRDVLARAKTGSGKTLSYAIPVAQNLLRNIPVQGGVQQEYSFTKKGIPDSTINLKCLVLVPTRELCRQVAEVFSEVLYYCSDVLSVYHTADNMVSSAQLLPDILVCTPHAVMKLHKRLRLDLKRCIRVLVVDEADLMFSFGFERDMRDLINLLPHGSNDTYQAILCSATLNVHVEELKGLALHKPLEVTVTEEEENEGTTNGLSEYCYMCTKDDKWLVAYALIKLKLIPTKCLIFTNSVERAYGSRLFLEKFGIPSAVLSPTLPHVSRQSIIESFNQGVFELLIAPDVEQGELIEKEERQQKARAVQQVKMRSTKHIKLDEDEDTAEEEDKEAKEENREEEKGRKKHKRKRATKKSRESDDDVEDIEMEDATKELLEGKVSDHPPIPLASSTSDYFSMYRGLDFNEIASVLNLDTPLSVKAYTHRIGRTARAGKAGIALTLAATDIPVESQRLETIRKARAEESEDGNGVRVLQLCMTDIECFRYRVEDVARGVTPKTVAAMRARELQREALTCKRLKEFFAQNPQDHFELKKAARQIKEHQLVKTHLKHLPSYLVSQVKHVARTMTPVEAAIQEQGITGGDSKLNTDSQAITKKRSSKELNRIRGSRTFQLKHEPNYRLVTPEQLPPISGRKLWKVQHKKKMKGVTHQLYEDPLKVKQRRQKRFKGLIARKRKKKGK